MAMEISGGIASPITDLRTSMPDVTRKDETKTVFKNVDDYSKHLQKKYDYINAGIVSIKGVPTSVSVSSGFLKRCMDNPEKSSMLEEKMKAIPKCNEIALSRCQGTLTNINYKIDDNGNMTMIISGSSDPDGKIARENAKRKADEEKSTKERAEQKRLEKKAEEKRLEKRHAEMTEENDLKDFIISVVGADIRSMADQLTEKLGSESVDGTVGLDVRA